MPRRAMAITATVAFAAAACQTILGIDRGAPIADAPDAFPLPPPPSGEAGPDAPATVYHDVTDPSFWSRFDIGAIGAGGGGYTGGAFDGRHVYFAPERGGMSGLVARFDTQGSFTDPDAGAWDAFELLNLNGSAAGYVGAAFGGGRVYFAPYTVSDGLGIPTSNGTVAVHAADGGLGAADAWEFFNTGGLPTAPAGFNGAVFDGQYVYFVPASGSIVARYDTSRPLADITSWSTFDLVGVSPSASGYTGAVFDGQYLYLVPSYHGAAPHGVVARFDTKGTFISAQSWSTFDTASINLSAKGYFGGVFDGRYVYLVPGQSDLAAAIVVRYDTQGAFDAGTSWTPFSTASLSSSAKGFAGGLFDGRYMYLVPYGSGESGLVTRFDTTGSFSDTASWKTFDTAGLDGGGAAVGFRGAVFDGRYAYFVPMAGSVVVRFDAKEPPALPSGQTGSFL